MRFSLAPWPLRQEIFNMALATIDLPGGIVLSYLAKTAAYTIGAFDSTIDCTSGTFTVTLPTAVGRAGRTYVIKNSGSGVITVDAAGSSTIDGTLSVILITLQGITLQSNGTNWIINVSCLPYLQGSWTPIVTLVGGAANVVPVYSTNSGTYTRIGRLCFFNLLLSGDGGADGAGTGQVNISLPFTSSSAQLSVRAVSGTAVNGANEVLLSILYAPSSGTISLFQGASDLIAFPGSLQGNASRSISLVGSFLV